VESSPSGIFSTGTFSTGTGSAGGGVFRSRALVVLATVAIVGLLWAGKVLFVMFFFALFLSFALQPFVTLLERLRFPRAMAVLVVIVFLSALVVFFAFNAMIQIEAFTHDLPAYEARIRVFTAKLQNWFTQIERWVSAIVPEGDRSTRSVRLESDAFDSLSRVALQVRTIVSLLLYTAAIPMLSFFMLKDREKYGGAVAKILRIKGGRAAQDFAVGVARVLSGYVLGELFVVLITACITTAGLLVLRVPYGYVLGPLAGMCVLVPYVGVIISTLPAFLISLLASSNAALPVKVLIFYSVVQFLEGNVLTPFIVGSRVRLHPLAVLFAFLFWGILWGVPGAILAVPLTATFKVVTERFDRFAPWAALLGERTPDPPPPEEPEALLAGHQGA
jgi:predicted PurR-regulated permease PerM